MAMALESPTTVPLTGDAARFYEVVGDLVVETTPLGARESWIARLLLEVLLPFVKDRALGQVTPETLFDLRPVVDRQRRPDLAYLSEQTWPSRRPAPRVSAWPAVPDLAVEIVSPTNTSNEILGKIDEYFRAGVRRVWVVHPEQEKLYDYASPKEVRILDREDVLEGGEILPGFRFALSEVFFEDLPAV